MTDCNMCDACMQWHACTKYVSEREKERVTHMHAVARLSQAKSEREKERVTYTNGSIVESHRMVKFHTDP